jgi:hypothetical protein
MENLINYYTDLMLAKCLHEKIATDLREITSDWTIKYDEEIEVKDEKAEQAAACIEPDINDADFYKQIDDLLAKAHQSIASDSATSANKKHSLDNKIQEKTAAVKIDSRSSTATVSGTANFKKSKSTFTLNKPKPKPAPPPHAAHLKAPYKTTILKPVSKPASTLQINKKSQSTENLNTIKKEVDLPKHHLQQKPLQQTSGVDFINKPIEKQIITHYKSVSFKEMAMNLYLSPKLEYLTIKSTELALKIAKKKRKSSAKQSFLSKLTQNFCTVSSNSTAQPSLLNTRTIFKQTRNLLSNRMFQIDTPDTVMCYFKLKILLAYFESFNENIQSLLPKEVLSLRLPNDSNSYLIDVSLFDSSTPSLNSQSPVQYEKCAQLIRLNDLKCDLAEIEFKIMLFNHLKSNVLSNYKSNEKCVEYLKLVYSFISNKKVIIAS